MEEREGRQFEERRERRIVEEGISTLEEAGKRAPKIEGVPTGVDGLDEMFFTTKIDKSGKPRRVPLGGIPRYAVVNLTGVSDTGKSLMAEQFAISQAARGEPVAFITVETPANFVAASLRERARAMGVDFEEIKDKIVLIDAASYHALREDIPTLLNTLAHAIKQYGIKHVVVDSITGLYEAKEMMARQIVRQLFNFLKKWHQTAIFVSQKRSGHEELTAEAAGGYAVSHIVDCSIVLAKKMVQAKYEQGLYKKPIGDLVRLIRIDGCRMCGHDLRTHFMEITEEGLVKIGPPLTAAGAKEE